MLPVHITNSRQQFRDFDSTIFFANQFQKFCSTIFSNEIPSVMILYSFKTKYFYSIVYAFENECFVDSSWFPIGQKEEQDTLDDFLVEFTYINDFRARVSFYSADSNDQYSILQHKIHFNCKEVQITVLDPNYDNMNRKFVSIAAEEGWLGLLIDEHEESILLECVEKASKDLMKEMPFVFAFNAIRFKNQHETSERKSASICLFSKTNLIFECKEILRSSLDMLIDTVNGYQTIIKNLHKKLTHLDIPIQRFSNPIDKKVWRYCIADRDAISFKTSLVYFTKEYLFNFPLALQTYEIPDDRVSIVKLVSKFGKHILLICNAILCEKRIVFYGETCPFINICAAAISATLMIDSHLHDYIIKQRTFPFVDYQELNSSSIHKVKGFIIGTCDSKIKNETDCYDILCNVDTGEVISMETLKGTMGNQVISVTDTDLEFYDVVNHLLVTSALKGGSKVKSEESVQLYFQDYTNKLLQLACLDSIKEAKTEEMKRLYDMNLSKLRFIKTTHSLLVYQQGKIQQRTELKLSTDLENLLEILYSKESKTEKELLDLYDTLIKHTQNEQQIKYLLTLLPEHKGGLYTIATAQMHPSPHVRSLVTNLLTQIEITKEGHYLLSSMNTFLLVPFLRK